jgi:hypothetical protein
MMLEAGLFGRGECGRLKFCRFDVDGEDSTGWTLTSMDRTISVGTSSD